MKKFGVVKKLVLAYSGGLDTSVALVWLKKQFNCEVIAYCCDVGQGDDLEEVRGNALRVGADDVVVEDVKDEFAEDYIFPMLRANALYEGKYMLGTSIARPLIAKKHIELAMKLGADAVAHGATGKGNDQVRFELVFLSMKPDIKIIAPWRIWDLKSREDLIDYAAEHKIPIKVTKKKPHSIDRNLFHISFEGGELEDAWTEAPADLYEYTLPVEKAAETASYVEIGFEKGNPVSVNGHALPPAKLISELNRLGGENGIGRVDLVENRYVGMKSRGVYETPGGTIILEARRALESITLDREVQHIKDEIMPKYARLVYYGYWFSPERKMLQTMIDSVQDRVNGTVKLKLYKGNCIIAGRKSPNSLFRKDLATFGKDDVYDQSLAEGFIKLNALRLSL